MWIASLTLRMYQCTRNRHEKQSCWKRLEKQQGESTTMTTVSPEDVASVGSDEGSINEDSEDK